MQPRTMVRSLADFAVTARWPDLSEAARDALGRRILDSLGCALGALKAPPLRAVRAEVAEMGGNPLCTVIGGGRTSADRAAFLNGAAIRYLDFNDSYLAKNETCHPSDNLAPVLAAAEHAGRGGRDLLASLAVAYQVQCRLCDVAPVRARGFDHTTLAAYSMAAGAARALGLDAEQAANAIAISGAAFNSLRVTRTGALSNWKGLAAPNTAFCAIHAAYLAKHGITGPPAVFEGNKGFMDAIAGPFQIDWSEEDLERVTRTVTKRYNAEVHSQSVIEAVLELREQAPIDPADIDRVEVAVFDVAYHIIGGGEEGEKMSVLTKEDADHSIPYLVAVALLDGQVLPAQFESERILRPDVQRLLRKVDVRPDDELSRRFPDHHSCRVRIHLQAGPVLAREKQDYAGDTARPASWEDILEKFDLLAVPVAGRDLAGRIANAVRRLADDLPVVELMQQLARVPSVPSS